MTLCNVYRVTCSDPHSNSVVPLSLREKHLSGFLATFSSLRHFSLTLVKENHRHFSLVLVKTCRWSNI